MTTLDDPCQVIIDSGGQPGGDRIMWESFDFAGDRNSQLALHHPSKVVTKRMII